MCVCVYVCMCLTHLLWAELVGAAHEVCAEQGEGDGVAGLRRQLQALLEHLLKRTTVKAIRGNPKDTDRQRKTDRLRGRGQERETHR